MTNRIHSVAGHQAAALLMGALAAFTLVAVPVAVEAQAPAQLASTHRWVHSKSGDREAMALVGIGQDHQCDPRNDTGPFDPLACLESQKSQWLALQKVARKDPQASQTVRHTLTTIVEELTASAAAWRSLSPAARDRETATRRELALSVANAGQNVVRGLEAVIRDPTRSEEVRSTARRMLALSRDRGGISGWFWGCLACVCVRAEGCPCCGYGLPQDILQKKPAAE